MNYLFHYRSYITGQKHLRDHKRIFIESPRHPNSVDIVRFTLNGEIFQKASLPPLGINLIEYMDPPPTHQSGSVDTVRFPLIGHILNKASLSPLGINLIEYMNP